MLKFIHAADFHLDAPFTAHSAEEARRRREEQRLLPGRLADLCAAEGADLVLLAGDLLDGERVYRETLESLAAALERMAVPVFIAPGNHDFYGARTPYAAIEWPKNVHIFTSDRVETVELPGLGCTVCGAAFTAPACDLSPLRGFSAPAAPGRPWLMVLHGDVDGKGRYGSILPEDIAASGLTYLALGHIHACSGLQRAGRTAWAYPGCPEGRGFDELGDKGVLVGTIDELGNVDARFVPLAERRYQIYRVDLTGQADPAAALEAALPKGGERDLVRILLTGERDGSLDLEALGAVAAPYFAEVTLRDMTRLSRALWERSGENTLTGLFLREMRGRIDAAEDDAARERLERAARYGLAALEGREEVGA